MTEPTEARPKNYRWALYVLIFLVGWLLGKERGNYEKFVYVGPDKSEAQKAMLQIVVEPPDAK